MAEIRTLRLNLLADTKDFIKGLNHASGYSKTFAGRLGASMRKATMAMGAAAAAAGVLAVKLGIDAVKGAMEDEASQKRLAAVLKKTTKATDAQVASTEKWITAQQFAKGYSDTELRGALGRLTASTHNVTKAQNLLVVAQDVSRGTGRNLEETALAISKAYDGNLGALKRLGVPLDAATAKSKDFNKALKVLVDTYGGQASTYADTFAGRMAILNQRWDEFKESVGTKVIAALSKLLPKIQEVVQILSGDDPRSMTANLRESRDTLTGGPHSFAYALIDVRDSFSKLFTTISGNGPGSNSVLNDMATVLHAIASGIRAITNAYKAGRRALQFLFPHGLTGSGGSIPLTAPAPATGYPFSGMDWTPSGSKAVGGTVRAGGTYLVGEHGPEMLTLGAKGGTVTSNGNLGGGTTVINLNGIVDAESARRAIERIIQQSSRRTGAVNWNPVLT